MCGCEPTFVCSRCTGDPRQDWRLAFELDAQTVEEREAAVAARLWMWQAAPAGLKP